jgi:hypothetical protein
MADYPHSAGTWSSGIVGLALDGVGRSRERDASLRESAEV